jgi:hypothetical protein
MNKNIPLFFCFCLVAGLLVIHHLPRQVTNSGMSSKNTAIQPVSRPIITVPLVNPVAKTAFVQTGQVSNTVARTELAIMTAPAETNVAADGGKEIAEQEKYRLLRELRELAAKDPEGALAAAMKLPVGDERNEALEAVCFGIAETDPADAVKMAKSLNLDAQPGAIMENLVQQWAVTDLSSAQAWANNQPAGEQRDGLTMRIAYIMSQTDPASAANLVVSQITPGSTQDEAVMTVLNQWANQDLNAATTWVKGFSVGPLQERAINELEGIANYQHALAHQ